MTEEQFVLELKKLLVKAINTGMDPDTVCALVEATIKSDAGNNRDWTYND